MSHKTVLLLNRLSTLLALVSASILLQTLYFKFTAHPESIALFTSLGVEPWGRITTGVLELIASILILIPRTRFWGAISVCAVMLGAIASHMFVLGISGTQLSLFILACVAFVCADVSGAIVHYLKHTQKP